jgi:hypothetical protein
MNEDHLFLGTDADNIADMTRKGRRNDAKGEDKYNAILTEDQVREIRSGPYGYKRTAKMYGITKTNVRNIRLGKKWKHVAVDGRPARP